MLNMAKADLYRIFRSKGMYVFIGLIILTYTLSIISKNMVGFYNGYDPTEVTQGLKVDIRMLGFNFNFYYLMLIPVSVILLVDFSEKTIKNTLSSVTTKRKYYIFKWLLLQCIGIFCFLWGNTLYYFCNRLINGEEYSSAPSDFFRVLLLQLPTLMAIISGFVFFAFLLRRTAVFNVFMLMITEVYSLTIGFLMMFNRTESFAKNHLVSFDISYVLQNLAGKSTTSYKVTAIVISMLITAVFFIAGLRIYNHSEPTDL